MHLFLLVVLSCAVTKVITSPWKPLVDCNTGSSNKSSFSGYSVDLMFKIATELQWEDEDWDFTCV